MAKFMTSCPDPLLKLTDDLIEHIRSQTELKITRSGLIQILFGILVKNAAEASFEGVYDDESLKDAIIHAIYKNQEKIKKPS